MATKYSQKFPIPQGFAEILHDFTREILRDQPEDILEYSTLYFEALHQGKPFHYESKYNVKPDKPQGSHYLPHGKKEFDAENPPQKVEKTEKTERTEKSEKSVPRERPSEEVSEERSIHSRDTSHKDEKSLAREYIKDLNEEILEQAVGAEEKSSVGKQSSKVLEDVNLSQGPKETEEAGEEEAVIAGQEEEGAQEAAAEEEEAAAGGEAEGEEEAAPAEQNESFPAEHEESLPAEHEKSLPAEHEEAAPEAEEKAAAEQEEAVAAEQHEGAQEAAAEEPKEVAAEQEEGN
jgi:hypothetical protein